MRKLAAILLAFPVLARIYVPTVATRGRSSRIAAGLLAGFVIFAVAFASLPPQQSAAVKSSGPVQPVSAALLNTLTTGHALTAPLEVSFDAPMDPASVAAALRIAPDAAVSFSWSADGRTLSIAPVDHWAPDTLYVVSVSDAARSAGGGRLDKALRVVVLTAGAGKASIAATKASGGRARLDTAFLVTLDRPVAPEALEAALTIEPPVEGKVTQGPSPSSYVFTPADALAPATTYRLSVSTLRDADGVAFAPMAPFQISTGNAPQVVRFRPTNGDTKVSRSSLLSVRFTERMSTKPTAAALSVTADGKPVKGAVTWAEQQKVLVFRPAAALPYGAKVVITVGAGASSRFGIAMDEASSGTFTVEAKPAPKPKPKPKPAPKPKPKSAPISRSGGGGSATASWYGVEKYYLKLMNCTRTGGWVTSSGSCSSPGGRNVAPLSLSSGISSKVSRPYAKLLATNNLCSHFINGNPGDRLRRAGYTSYRWAENLGCRSGDPYNAVLGSHLYFQSEKPYNGGHYVNLMNAMYDRCGIGVWVSHSRVRLVIDFYHP